MLKLIVDDRENAVIPYFKKYDNFTIQVQRIQIGDYVITQNDRILFCIERKSWADLAASIKDGRSTNINKMISLREQTGCKLLYLLEGKSRYAATKKFGRIPYKNLQSHLDHLVMRDNVFVIHANDQEDSVNRLTEFMTNYLSLQVPNTEIAVIGGTNTDNKLKILTAVVPKTDAEIISNMWSAIPNITEKTAALFSEYHISDLFLGNVDKSTIAQMRYPNNSIIGKRSEKIIKVIDNANTNNFKVYCNILSEIPRITKKTAALILLKVKFNDLIAGKLSIGEIAVIKKTENRTIGIASAEAIYKFLVKK
jgi:ERCC4-type nuclease